MEPTRPHVPPNAPPFVAARLWLTPLAACDDGRVDLAFLYADRLEDGRPALPTPPDSPVRPTRPPLPTPPESPVRPTRPPASQPPAAPAGKRAAAARPSDSVDLQHAEARLKLRAIVKLAEEVHRLQDAIPIQARDQAGRIFRQAQTALWHVEAAAPPFCPNDAQRLFSEFHHGD